jgi:hypothetical protein
MDLMELEAMQQAGKEGRRVIRCVSEPQEAGTRDCMLEVGCDQHAAANLLLAISSRKAGKDSRVSS